MTTIYHYDKGGIYLYSTQARIDKNDGSIEVPANATTLQPIGVEKPKIDLFDLGTNQWTIFTPEPIQEAGEAFAPDPPPEPTIEERRAVMVISKVKAMQSLKKAGKLDAVFDLMDTLPRDSDMRILWDYSENLRRTDATLVKVCKDQLGLDDLGIDNLFM